MSNCLDLAEKKALIFHQADYSLTKLCHKDFSPSLPSTKEDAVTATHLARGFGIGDRNIVHIEDMSIEHIDEIMNKIKREFRVLGQQGRRTFLFVYCAGYGVADLQ